VLWIMEMRGIEIEPAGFIIAETLLDMHPAQVMAQHPFGRLTIGHDRTQLGRTGFRGLVQVMAMLHRQLPRWVSCTFARYRGFPG